MAQESRGQGVEDQRAFARAADPGDTGEGAKGNFQVDSLEVVGGRPPQNQLADGSGSTGREGNLAPSGKEGTREGVFGRGNLPGSALGHEPASFGTGAGAELDQVIGAAESLFVMLDD